MGRRIVSFLLSVCVLAGSLTEVLRPGAVFAGSLTEEQVLGEMSFSRQEEEKDGGAAEKLPAGLLPVVEVEVVPDGGETVYGSREEISLSGETMRRSAVYQSEWDKYKNYYVYNQMTEEEQAFWDVLDAVCMQYLLTSKDTEYHTGGGYYYTAAAGSDGLWLARMKEIARLFRYSNPQYYFLNHYLYWSSQQTGEKWVAFGVYSAFNKGAARERETANVRNQIDAWQSEIDLCTSDAEKVKKIHDLIIKKMDYNSSVTNEDKQYSQSAYSVFCKSSTVCTGYAMAFELMCNGSGIDAMTVTSPDHAWNKVRVNDSWYNVDCTWDDPLNQSTVLYTWFERNDPYYDRGSNSSSHQEEGLWLAYLPVCSLDTSPPSGGATPGTLPEITDQTAAPVIGLADGNAVIASDTDGAVIYYTLDGTDPSPSSAKCRKYTAAFPAEEEEIRAVAVCDRKWDSRVVSGRKHKIVYDGNGALGGSMEEQVFVPGDDTLLGKNAFKRRGYVFYGWNTEADGTGTAYDDEGDASGLTESVVLYAQWKPEQYTITYHLNGGTNGDNPSSFCCESERITLKDPFREGYIFAGWYLDSAFRDRVVAFAKGTIGDRQVYAKWSENGSGTSGSGGNETGGSQAGENGSGGSGAGGGQTGGNGSGGSAAPGNTADGNGVRNPKEIGTAAVKLSKTKYSYDGKAKKPAVTVTLGGKRLASGSDYTVAYRNNKNIGTASVIVTGTGAYTGSVTAKFVISPKKGSSFTVKEYQYKITGTSEVAFAGLKNAKTTKVTIPASVKIGGRSFKVTSIAGKALQKKTKIKSVVIGNHVKTIGTAAFSGCTGLTRVTIGTGLTEIGREAFRNCSKLKVLTIKSTKLKSVGKDALRGIRSDAGIKVPAKRVKAYQKLFKGKGQGSQVTVGS